MMILVCQICGEKASPVHELTLPVIIGDEVVLKKAILCGSCNSFLEEEVEKYLPLKQAEIVSSFLKVRGVRVEGLEDYEGYMK